MSSDKPRIAAAAGATAALFSVAALTQALLRKGALSTDDVNEVYAVAASMCRANGTEEGAQAIEMMVPTSKDIDPVQRARDRGDTIMPTT